MPVEYVDPHGKRTWIYRASEQFARTRVGRRWGMHVAPRIDPWLYRISNGRYPVVMGMVLNAPLLTTGAKTGQPRLVHVVYFHDGVDPIIIASYGGEPRNPQWYHNLKAHPECKFGDEDFIATEVTDPDEYDRLYQLAECVYSGFHDYRIAMASTGGRRIPVFRLRRR
jgi:deazaflavin-dependent oxidoreductase (nitroreductase family)